MRYFFVAVVLGLSLLLLLEPTAPAQPGNEPLVKKVGDAIAQGISYLRRVENQRGNWEDTIESKSYPGGWTSLALLALLNSGVKPTDDVIQRGLASLRKIEPTQTYVVGLQTMVYAQAGLEEDRQRIQRNVDWLIAARGPLGWSYNKTQVGSGDNSNTQYALLGVHDGLQAGAKVAPEVLKSLQDFYTDTQSRDGGGRGGWGYRRNDPPSMAMTAAGVCGLVITGMDVAAGRQILNLDTGVAQNCGVYKDNEPVAAGLEWIGRRFPAVLNRETMTRFQAPFYTLYGLERTGRLTGQRYFGGHDWYRLGCEYLVSCQKNDGSWEGVGIHPLDNQSVVATSFSLLFLSKGRTPILVTKFAHDDGDEWNRKRSDVRHVVEFASKELFKKQPMAWQVFDIRKKPAEDAHSQRELASELLPSPLLYLNGHMLRLSDKEKNILREYVNNGGFLLAEACCGERQFDSDFRALMEELFPDSKLRKVPPDHPVWYASGKFALKPSDFFDRDDSLWGIQQGCKWVVLYSPKPLAGYWEDNLFDRGRGRVAFQLAANIIAYATGLEPPRPRLTEVAIAQDDPVSSKKPKRGYLEVVQLAHDGDWRPAPRAMRFLMEEVRKTGVDALLTTAQARLSDGVGLDDGPVRKISDSLFFYLHGRRSFTASPKALKELRFRLEGGATLLADACCGSRAFDEAFRQTMTEMWADQKLKLEPIPLTDELFSRELNGVKISEVRCRREGPDGQRASPEYQSVPPALEGIKYKDRWVVIYSRYDLGCALEKHQSTDCLGHDYASAALLGKAAVLYALKR